MTGFHAVSAHVASPWHTAYSLTTEALQSEKTVENNTFQWEANRRTLVRKTERKVYCEEDSKEHCRENKSELSKAYLQIWTFALEF